MFTFLPSLDTPGLSLLGVLQRIVVNRMEDSIRGRRQRLFILLLLIAQGLAIGKASATSEPFLEQFALRVINLTQATYCPDQLEGWNCTFCADFPGMRNVSKLQGKRRNVRGYIGVDVGDDFDLAEETSEEQRYMPGIKGALPGHSGVAIDVKQNGYRENLDTEGSTSSQRIVVTFSGTDPRSVKNWADDLEACLVSHSYANGTQCSGCKVHDGFLATYEVVQDQVRATVAGHLQYHPNAEVLITGHSLGAALATLCFLDLRYYLDEDVSFAPLYIFGAPRVGNAAFARFTASHGVPIYRIVHFRDPVPHLPLHLWGYHHPPTEVFFDLDQDSYVVCDDTGEDPHCSTQFWVVLSASTIREHLNYLGVDYTTCKARCEIDTAGDEDSVDVEDFVDLEDFVDAEDWALFEGQEETYLRQI